MPAPPGQRTTGIPLRASGFCPGARPPPGPARAPVPRWVRRAAPGVRDRPRATAAGPDVPGGPGRGQNESPGASHRGFVKY